MSADFEIASPLPGAAFGATLVLAPTLASAEETVRIAQGVSTLSFVPIWAARALNTFAPQGLTASAVVVPGARAVKDEWGQSQGISLQTPVIVKYRDSRTDTRTELEAWIR